MSGPSLSELDLELLPEIGELAQRSGRLRNEFSQAQLLGAENLVDKALRALAAGDGERAERLIGRAAQMPYDEWEGAFPGVRAALTLVYDTITDQFEDCEQGDSTWLDVVLAVDPGLDPMGRVAVASIVHGFVLQESFYTVSASEKRRIRAAFGGAPLEPDLANFPNTSIGALRDLIRSLVTAAVALEGAYAAA